MRCINVWILRLARSQIPHRWMIMVHQSLDLSVHNYRPQSPHGQHVMPSHVKPFFVPSNLPTFSRLFLIATVSQQCGPVLKNEYDRPLDFEYIRVNNEFMNLRKDDNTIMNTHITRFNQLLQEVEYNKSITIVSLEARSHQSSVYAFSRRTLGDLLLDQRRLDPKSLCR